MASYKNRHQDRQEDYDDKTNVDETSYENSKKSMSKFSSVKVKSRMSKSKLRALSASEQPSKRGGSQSLPNSPPNEVENDAVFINNYNYLKSQLTTQSAPNSPKTQRKLEDLKRTTNGSGINNKSRRQQLARANSLSDLYSKANADQSGSNLIRIRKLSVGSVEVLRGALSADTEAERERKFVAKYNNGRQVIEQKGTSSTTVTTQNQKSSTQNHIIMTSKVQRKIVTESTIQQTNTTSSRSTVQQTSTTASRSTIQQTNTTVSRTNSRSVDDQHIVKYRNRPIILQRKRPLGSIEVSRQQMMNLQNKEKEPLPPSNRRLYRSSSVGAIRHALQKAGHEPLPNKGNITTTITISPQNKPGKSKSANPAPTGNNIKPKEENRKISNDHVVSDIIKPTKAAKNESNPIFNTRIGKASVAPAATNSSNGPTANRNTHPSKNGLHENGHTGTNKGIATTVKLNGKIVATKISNDSSHPIKSTVIANGFASSKNGTASKSAASNANAKLSHAGVNSMTNGNRYKPSAVANRH